MCMTVSSANQTQLARVAIKKHLSAPGLFSRLRTAFSGIKQLQKSSRGRPPEFSLTDCLMSGLAMFSLKFVSLLQFDQESREETTAHNLHSLFGVTAVPSDTQMRERLDNVDPTELRPAFKQLFAALQRGKALEDYLFLGKYYLVSQDGTESFSSDKIHCTSCCQRHHKDGRTSYYHQLLAAVVVHPDHREVFPLCPEPITKQDGGKKNDCERNASFRLLQHIRREHPHLSLVVTSDALNANGPYIRHLLNLNMHYIIVVKPDGNKTLFNWLHGISLEQHRLVLRDGCTYHFKFYNGVPLNDAHHNLSVNYFQLDLVDKKGELHHFSWITDLHITKENLYELSRGGRAKWKIENETFNTLKNQGYNFEHNFGHGEKNLWTILTLLMFLAFLVDNIQQRCCGMFQAALKKVTSKVRLWGKLRALWEGYRITSWEDVWLAIANGLKACDLVPNTC